jgi:hypothetical protein
MHGEWMWEYALVAIASSLTNLGSKHLLVVSRSSYVLHACYSNTDAKVSGQ